MVDRVILSAFGTEGNVNSVLGITAAIEAAGVPTTLITHGVFTERYKNCAREMVAVDSPLEYRELASQLYLLNTARDAGEFFRRFAFRFASAETAAAVRIAEKRRTVLVTTDAPGLGLRVAADLLHAPLVSLFQAPGFLRSRNLYGALLENDLRAELRYLRESHGLGDTDVAATTWVGRTTLDLALWPSWFRRPEIVESGPRLRHVGFVWFDRAYTPGDQRPSDLSYDVVVTGGSSAVSSDAFYLAAMDGCHRASKTALVVAPDPSMLPHTLPPSCHRVGWTDLRSALLSARTVIHHGGIGSIVDAIRAGIPQLVLAHGGDRPENARTVQALMLGRHLPRQQWSADTVASSLRELDASASIQTAARTAASVAHTNGAAIAAQHILACGETVAAPRSAAP